MNIMKTKFGFILLICILSIGFSACEQAQQVIHPVETRDHVWVVNQNGVETPVPGTWVVVSQTHPDAPVEAGDSFTLPANPQHKHQVSEGTYTDGEGILWTKVKITPHSGRKWQFLERVDTSVSPHRLYVVHVLDANNTSLLEYGTYPFEPPRHNVVIREKE